MPISLRAQVAPTYSMPRFESGNVSAPTIAFDASQSTGLSYADGIAVSHHGAQVLHVGNTVTIDTVLVGNGAGLSGIHASNVTGLTQALDVIDASSVSSNVFVGDGAGLSNVSAANITGLTQALDVIDASSVSSNVFIGDGAGLSNIAAANVTGLTQALDVIDASSVTANTFVGDGAGLSNIAAANVVGDLSGNVAADDLTVTTLSSDLLPSANVTYDIGSATQRFRDLYLSGNTIDLAGALIQALGANVFIQNLDVGSIRGNGAGLTGISIPPSITSVVITDSNWNPIDDLALSTTSTGYLTIQGTNFEPVGTTVSVGGTAAASVTVVSSQVLRVSVNPKTSGTYDIVVETWRGTASKINGVSFDPFPVWSTSSSLGNVVYGNAFSITLAASDGGSSITYSNTTSLPPSTTLASNGLLQGNITVTDPTTYSFSVEAIDAQLQSAIRSFSLFVVSRWQVLMAYNGVKVLDTDPRYSSMGSPGSTTFRAITSASTGANSRVTLGDGEGLYSHFFTLTGITKIAIVNGSSLSPEPTQHSRYAIYDLVESTGAESMYDILLRIDTFLKDVPDYRNNDTVFSESSAINLTAGTNGYSGLLSASSSPFVDQNGTVCDKFCVWGINRDNDNDTQALAFYSGNLQSGKGDQWRGTAPAQTFWSYWGHDFHLNSSTTQQIGSSYQTLPGIGTSQNNYTGMIYLLAFS